MLPEEAQQLLHPDDLQGVHPGKIRRASLGAKLVAYVVVELEEEHDKQHLKEDFPRDPPG